MNFIQMYIGFRLYIYIRLIFYIYNSVAKFVVCVDHFKIHFRTQRDKQTLFSLKLCILDIQKLRRHNPGKEAVSFANQIGWSNNADA